MNHNAIVPMTVTEFESHQEPGPPPRTNQTSRTSSFPCPECGGSAPVKSTYRGYQYTRLCKDCGARFNTIIGDGPERLAPPPGSKKITRESSTFLSIHWAIASDPKLSRKRAKKWLQALKRAGERLEIEERVTFEPLTKKEKEILYPPMQ